MDNVRGGITSSSCTSGRPSQSLYPSCNHCSASYVLPIFALFAGLPLGDIPVAIPAPPIVLPVIAPADQALGIIVIAIIAPPPVLFGAAPAGVALGGVPPVGWIVALPATFHVVACGVAVGTASCPPCCGSSRRGAPS